MMELDKLLISIVLISVFAISIGAFVIDTTNNYDVSIDPTFQHKYNKMNESFDLAEDIKDDIKGASVDETVNDDWDIGKTIKAGLNAIKSVFVQGIPTVLAMVTNLGEYMQLPGYILTGIQAIIFIALAFALIYLYFRYKNG